MSKGNWVRELALGLAVIASVFVWAAYHVGSEIGEARGERNKHTASYQHHAEDQIRRTCLSGEGRDVAECVAKIIKATNEDQRAQDDLIAQTEMARWAFYMFIFTVIMAVITGAGVYYVWRTLSVTRVIGQAQTRAYLSAKIKKITPEPIRDPDGKNIKVAVDIQILNIGNTHATDIETFFFIGDTNPGVPFGIVLERDGGRSQKTLSSVSAGGKSNITISRRWRIDDIDRFSADPNRFIRIILSSRYKDVFGVKCETPMTSGTIQPIGDGRIRFVADRYEMKPDA